MTEPTTEKQPAPGATPGPGANPGPAADQQEQGGAKPPTPGDEGSGLETALKAEREARKQAERDLKALKDQQQSGLTESERLAQRVAELEAANIAAERQALVLKIATETGLPPLWASRLQGTDETSLRADAEALKQTIPAQPPQPPTTVGGPQGAPTASRSPEEWVTTLRARRG